MLLGGRPMADWIAEYARSHQHPVNRACHTVGIPTVTLGILLLLLSLVVPGLWNAALGVFVAGWILQFAGHAAEGKPPEFFRDWRFLFVGLRWWAMKVRGRA